MTRNFSVHDMVYARFLQFLLVFIVELIDHCVLIYCDLQVVLARQIYDEQLPIISKILSAAIVGLLRLILRDVYTVSQKTITFLFFE